MRPARQEGQATIETLIAIMVMVPFFVGMIMLGKYFDMESQVQSANRYAVWERTVWSNSGNSWGDSENHKTQADIRLESDRRFFGDNKLGMHSTVVLNGTGADNYGFSYNQSWHAYDGLSLVAVNKAPSDGRTQQIYSNTEISEHDAPGSAGDTMGTFGKIYDLENKTFAKVKTTLPVTMMTKHPDDILYEFKEYSNIVAEGSILTNSWSAPSEGEFKDRVDRAVADEPLQLLEAPAFAYSLGGSRYSPFSEGYDTRNPQAITSSMALPEERLK